MKNTISRCSAIDAMLKEANKDGVYGYIDAKTAVNVLNGLPEEEPEWTMGDLIVRGDAIDAIQGIDRLATLPDNDAVIRMSAVEYVLFNLPSAQPINSVECKNCKFSEEFQGDIWLCKRCKKSVIVLPTDTCSKAKKG